MKRVLSISLGSSARDHAVTTTVLDVPVLIERRGTDGDLVRALELYREFDGVVDAFGVGGIEFFVPVGKRRYYWRDARRIRAQIRKSKVGDGNGVRAILAKRAVHELEQHLNREGRTLRRLSVLKTTAVARYFLAEELVSAGCNVTFGDFMFALQLPFPLHSLQSVRTLASVLMPVVSQLPYKWLYSLGDEQIAPPKPKWGRYYLEADVIAGDFLQIRAHMPSDLRDKIILTNTTTSNDVEDLRARGVHLLVTETPRLNGRTFGTNVIEALLLALIDKPQGQIETEDLELLAQKAGVAPSLEILNPRFTR